MIAREDFINKLKSFNYDNEQIIRCLAYYDNSNSKNKQDIIGNYDSKRLIGVVNRWYGIVSSTKRVNIKKPVLLSNNLCVIFEKLGKYKQPFYDFLMMIENETDKNSLQFLLNQEVKITNYLTDRKKPVSIFTALTEELSSFAWKKYDELCDPTIKEKRKINKMIEELNKKDPTSDYIYTLEKKKKSDTET